MKNNVASTVNGLDGIRLRFSLLCAEPMSVNDSVACMEPELIELPIAMLGSYYHTRHKKFDITQKTFDDIRRNFEQRTIGFDPFLTTGHVTDPVEEANSDDPLASTWKVEDGEPNEGYLVEIVQRYDTLYGRYRPFKQETAEAVRDQRYMYSSAELYFDMPNQRTGKPMGTVLVCHALTNKPFMPDLPPNRVIQRFSLKAGIQASTVVEIPMNGPDAAVAVTPDLIAMLQAGGETGEQEDPMLKNKVLMTDDAGTASGGTPPDAASEQTKAVETDKGAEDTAEDPKAKDADKAPDSSEDEKAPEVPAEKPAATQPDSDPVVEAITKLSAGQRSDLLAVLNAVHNTEGNAGATIRDNKTPEGSAQPAQVPGKKPDQGDPSMSLTSEDVKKLVDAAVTAAVAPLNQELATTKTALANVTQVAQESQAEVAKFSAGENTAKVNARRAALLSAGVPPIAVDIALGANTAANSGLAKFSLGDGEGAQQFDTADAGLAALEAVVKAGGLTKFSQAGATTVESDDDFHQRYSFLPKK